MSGSILVTGASGFIGRALLPLLVEGSYEVHAVRRAGSGPSPAGVHWHNVDLVEQGACDELVRELRPSHLMHLAWYTTPGRYRTSPQNVAWLEASLALLRSFAAAGGRRAVLTGTCAEYDVGDGRCCEFTTPRRPTSLYGVCKNALHEISAVHAREFGYSSAWARIFYLYGPGEHRARLVPSVVESLLAGQPIELTDGSQRRDVLFVDDVASALLRLLSSDVAGPVNIGSGEATSVRRMASTIASSLARPDLIRLGTRSPGRDDRASVVADTTRLRQGLGWTPGVSLEEGIDRTVSWWRRQ
jgi:nucleoside-diphosphate-sugar epimerase